MLRLWHCLALTRRRILPFCAQIVEKIIASPLARLITTNSHPSSQRPIVRNSPKFIVVDVAPIFAGPMRHAAPLTSVSSCLARP